MVLLSVDLLVSTLTEAAVVSEFEKCIKVNHINTILCRVNNFQKLSAFKFLSI